MPSWPIHLTIANKISQKLKLNKNCFCYGNLIPDVDKNTKKDLMHTIIIKILPSLIVREKI